MVFAHALYTTAPRVLHFSAFINIYVRFCLLLKGQRSLLNIVSIVHGFCMHIYQPKSSGSNKRLVSEPRPSLLHVITPG